jgi:hypothetical protein
LDKSACNKLATRGETDVHPKGNCSETLRQPGEDYKGRVDVRIPVLRVNGIKDPDQVRLSGGEAEVPIARYNDLATGRITPALNCLPLSAD